MGAGGSRLFPEPVGWGRGTWLVVRALCLAGSSSHTHYFMPCHQRLPIPTHSSRQYPNNQPLCILPRVPPVSQTQEDQARVKRALALCCAVRKRTLSWFLVFNGDRQGKLMVQVALRGNQGHLSRGVVGIPDWGEHSMTRQAGTRKI